MKRVTSYNLTLGEAALVMLDELTVATLRTFHPHPYYHQFCDHSQPRSFYNALKRLERKYLVGRKRNGRREEWSLTIEGEKLARRLRFKIRYVKPKAWDGKWRVAIFDVPERMRGRRDFLRKELSSLGFYQLQKSVWVTPYPLPDEFFEMFTELGLGKQFRIITAEAISGDQDLRRIFFPAA